MARRPVAQHPWRARFAWLVGIVAVALLLVFLGLPTIFRTLGGASEWRALEEGAELSTGARALLEEVGEGLDRGALVDFHTHLAGIGDGSDCWVNPRLLSWKHPKDHVRFRIYLSAAGLDGAKAGSGLDRKYLERLQDAVRTEALPLRHLVLAFDHRYGADGERDLERSEFFVPNEAMWDAVQSDPARFLPCISVHPYRADALEQLDRWHARGVRFVKWLPNAMGIDPASERCDAYYARMAELGMVLITHTGMEQAVEAEADQELGNPLRLRRALGHGVRVIAAHCASSGESEDLDRPGERAPSFELLLRMFANPATEGLLFGEISTITQVNRFGDALAALLERPALHSRLVNGSDWPLPAVNVLFSLRALERAGFLTGDERRALAELYDYNPLVFDFALKRTVHAPGSGARFSAQAFEAPAELLELLR